MQRSRTSVKVCVKRSRTAETSHTGNNRTVRPSNIPVPESHVAALIAAAGVHAVLPLHIPIGRHVGRIIGGPLLAAGFGLAASAVASAGETELEGGDTLVTSGAFALSRNPMYVGWSAGILGLAFWTRSAWLLAGWALAVRALDREIDSEESQLLSRFGTQYRAYRAQVPRYVALAGRR
jgi:protein-S-isoprenylcysteine O-methyltransferase Ste14